MIMTATATMTTRRILKNKDNVTNSVERRWTYMITVILNLLNAVTALVPFALPVAVYSWGVTKHLKSKKSVSKICNDFQSRKHKTPFVM